MQQASTEFVSGQRTQRTIGFERALSFLQGKVSKYTRLSAQGGKALDAACAADPHMEELRKLDALLFARRELLPVDVQHLELLTNLLVAYSNDEFIGGRVMPSLDTNGQLNGNYWSMSREDRTAYPEDTVGQGGRVEVNVLSQSRSQHTYSIYVRSFKEHLDWYTVQNQASVLNELMEVMLNVVHGLEFKREIRVADTVFAAGNYASTNKVTIASGDRWNDSNGDPIGVIDTAKASVWGGDGRNGKLVLVAGRDAYKALKFHESLLHRIVGGATVDRSALINQRVMAELLEVDEVLVGTARKNTGTDASPTYARIWTTSSIALVRVAERPSKRTAAFGYCFEAHPTKQDLFWDPKTGAAGSWTARATQAYEPIVIAADTSYLISSAVN